MTFKEALAHGRAALLGGDGAAAARDARLLLAAAAELDMAALIARDREAMPAIAEARYESYLKRRAAGEPVARILGETEFWGLKFRLNGATLVPRPETETLVEVVLQEARRRPGNVSICDLGTGSGAIAIALLSELPQAIAVATDVSVDALEQARLNAEMHGVAARMRFVKAHFAEGPEGPFDIVVSNPPYIRGDVIPDLAVEVREHDPRVALDGGSDGLAAYRLILSRVKSLLAKDGLLALEVGYDQGESVAALCRQAGLAEVAIRLDLGGRERVVIARETLPADNP